MGDIDFGGVPAQAEFVGILRIPPAEAFAVVAHGAAGEPAGGHLIHIAHDVLGGNLVGAVGIVADAAIIVFTPAIEVISCSHPTSIVFTTG